MPFFYPDYRFYRIWKITLEWLREKGITVLLLDVDNTLTTHGNPDVDEKVLAWLEDMRSNGIRLVIVSNNSHKRVEPFAKRLGLDAFSRAAKPMGGRVRRALEGLDMRPEQAALVGDQIFTDVLCARLAGLTSILVEPMELEHFFFFKVKRVLERAVLRGWDAPGEQETDCGKGRV